MNEFSSMVKVLAKSGESIKAEMTARNANLLHMVIGISGEAGELLSGVVGKEDIKVCRDCKETKVIADYYSDSSKRPVAIFKDGEFLSVTLSVREADRLTGVHNGNIPRMIKEGGVSKEGFSFKYVDEAEADQSVRKDIAINITICASQLLDSIKKAVIYQKPLDIVNVVEELGDLEFYMEGLRQELGITREDTLQATINKLAVRYKGFHYSDTSAQERADKVSL